LKVKYEAMGKNDNYCEKSKKEMTISIRGRKGQMILSLPAPS